MRFLFILLVGCVKSPVLPIAPFTYCDLTIKVDATCVGYDESRYHVKDGFGNIRKAVLKPGTEATLNIVSGRFEMERVSFAAPGHVFANGFKYEKTESSNICDEKFTSQLICD